MAKIVFDGQTYAGSEDCLTCFGETGEQVSHAVVVMAMWAARDMSTGIGCAAIDWFANYVQVYM